ncbi:MAG: hypothetical protein AAGI68_00015 [Planctomycetota bacterium]
MITFAEQALFSSGPHALHLGPLNAQLSEHINTHPPAIVTRQGRQGRILTQVGTLVADSLSELLTQTLAIEAFVAGPPHTLDDGLGQQFPNTLLIQADFDAPQALGPRFRRNYRLSYRHLTP